ncbi:MAG: DarT ssDNA thymidine ADP-ribosyltransferase family protein [Paraclostridium sp.]|uniref:DarT ssDNA thymidine ADP-ribosyltransferase family protein n=1 Tax=Paraclostridium sp. TaxID=2023273 RepID=UPI003EE68339
MENLLNQMKKRNITRLCHFTKSKNLAHILNSFDGILATDMLPDFYKEVNDKSRFDGKKDYICCSIQYPNVFYLYQVKDNCKLFKDWIILSIDPKVILTSNILFCKVNAATESGKFIKQGIEGFNELYEEHIATSKRSISRSFNMPVSCPTDIQAEVMILEKIPREFIKEIIVPTNQQAKEESVRMKVLGVKNPPIIKVCPELFDKNLCDKLRSGDIPKEIEYKYGY